MTTPIKNAHIVVGAQSNDHSAYLAEVPTERFFTDAHTFARVQLLVSEYYRVDGPINFWDVYNVEAEAMGQKIIYVPGGRCFKGTPAPCPQAGNWKGTETCRTANTIMKMT